MPALDGIHVLDFTQVIFGPTCTQVLADHGADVIKVERPGQGDLARDFGPWIQDESLAYASLNRGKRSVAIDLKANEGREVIHRLLERADVLVHNFRPGVMERLGLDYPALESSYPGLIYAVGSGYGTTGPYVDMNKAGHETEAQALSGIVAKYRGPDDAPRSWPVPVADNTAGLLLGQAVLLALLARERTGHGQMVETSLLDGLMAMCAWETTSALNKARVGEESGPQPGPSSDTEHDDAVGGQNPLDGAVFGTSDGYLMVSALFRPYPQPLRDLCTALGIDDISDDSRFATLPDLISNTKALRAKLEPVFASRTTAEWVRQLESHDILCAPIRNTEEALQDPQLAVNGLIVEVEHPLVGRLRHVGTPLRLSKTSSRSPSAAPMLGQHTDEVLHEVGYSPGEVGELRSKSVVA